MKSLLGENERKRISQRLAVDLAGASLLVVGLIHGQIFADQQQLSLLIQALAAGIVSASALWRGIICGVFRVNAQNYTDQLVAFAALAAAANGDFLSATLVPLVLNLGRLFEERSALGAQAAIDALMALQAKVVLRLQNGEIEEIQRDELLQGDVVVVHPGQVIPGDGVIVLGQSAVDQSAITGESLPEDVGVGDEVFEGSQNISGLLHVELQKIGFESELGKVIALLQKAQQNKIPTLRQLEKWLAAYLPLALCLAATVLFFSEDIGRAIAILVVACPTALVLAGPAAMVASMSAAARHKIIIKNPALLEKLVLVDTLAVDKTGTLTTGQLVLSEMQPRGEQPHLLRDAALCAQASLHPVSRAIVRAAQAANEPLLAVKEAQEIPGCGVEAMYRGHRFRLGRLSWILESLEAPVSAEEDAQVWLSRDGVLLGALSFSDEIRSQAAEMLQQFQELGVEQTMLITGDRQLEAEKVSQQLQLEQVYAEVLPEQKAGIVATAQQRQQCVLMVGDGINDALALQQADVGIALGVRLSEVALGGADAALLSSDLRRLPWLLQLADRCRRTVIQNALLGVSFSLIMLGLAALGYISPLLGAVLHNAGAVLVIANSARLLRDGSITPIADGTSPVALGKG